MEKDELTWCVQSIMMIAAKAGLMTEHNLNELQAMLNDVYGDTTDVQFISCVAEALNLYKEEDPYNEEYC